MASLLCFANKFGFLLLLLLFLFSFGFVFITFPDPTNLKTRFIFAYSLDQASVQNENATIEFSQYYNVAFAMGSFERLQYKICVGCLPLTLEFIYQRNVIYACWFWTSNQLLESKLCVRTSAQLSVSQQHASQNLTYFCIEDEQFVQWWTRLLCWSSSAITAQNRLKKCVERVGKSETKTCHTYKREILEARTPISVPCGSACTCVRRESGEQRRETIARDSSLTAYDHHLYRALSYVK
jgi:hypothetical protein